MFANTREYLIDSRYSGQTSTVDSEEGTPGLCRAVPKFDGEQDEPFAKSSNSDLDSFAHENPS